MADGVLAAHRVDDGRLHRFYDLAGLRTASIRDQMVRAHMLVERLFKAKIIHDLPLLVIGGGAGGVTAAMSAGSLGVTVVLCERNAHLFGVQAKTQRVIDPTEYDWPHAHWHAGFYPWEAPPMPLAFPTARAHTLAMHWHAAFIRWLQTSAGQRVHYWPGTEVRQTDLQETPTHVGFAATNGPGPLRVGAVLSFAGIVKEKCTAPSRGSTTFRGFPYWGIDPYALPDFGLTGRSVSALISGGGDGALQDFIRIATGRSARRCYDAFNLDAFNTSPLICADDVARRAHAWRGGRGQSHQALQAWHMAYEAAAEEIWQSWDEVRRSELAETLLRKDVSVCLLLRCTHVDFAFGLNRLVFTLIARLYARNRGLGLAEVVRQRVSLARIEGPAGHVCGRPDDCHGVAHTAFAVASDCSNSEQELRRRNAFEVGEFHMHVLRHGADPNRLLGPPLLEEHAVPYHVVP